MKLNRKWLMVIALVMSLTMATAGTLAYLTDNDSATNTFTIGDVDIELEEPSWDPEDEPTLLPGVEIEKDPQIRNAGNTEAWVWMEIVIPAELYDIIELDYSTNGWTKGAVTTNEDGDKVVLMKYDSKLAAGATTTPPAFTTVSIPTSVTELPEGMETADIVVNAYAIQAEKIGSIEDAIKAYNGEEITPDEPDEPANGDDDSVTYDVPAGAVTVTSAEELAEQIANGETVFLLKAGTYHVPAECKNKTLTLVGEDLENTILEIVPSGQGEAGGQLDYGFDGSTVTFQNLTIKTNNATYAGYARLTGTYKNVNFDQQYCLQRDSVFEYCTFNVSGDQYNIWTWGAPTATFDHCTFNSDGKALLLYGETDNKVVLSNCVFNDTGVLTAMKAAVEVGSHNSCKRELIADNVDVNGYEINDTGYNTGTTLWGNKNSMGTDLLNVVVDGVDVY